MSSSRLGLAALICWLVTEALGAFMLRSWVTGGGRRERRNRPDAIWPRIIFGHAGLAFTGFVCWVSFVLSGSKVLAWLGLGFLALAIGLGVSTLTIWTPYPLHHPDSRRGTWPWAGTRDANQAAGSMSDDMINRALSSEATSAKLVDDLLARMLTADPPAAPRRWQLEPLVPAAHGLMAIATFLLGTLAAVAAST